MAAADESSELSSLSSLSPAPSDDELEAPSDVEQKPSKKSGILSYFSKVSDLPPKEPSPPPRKRSPSPPHEYVLADNPDIAVRIIIPSGNWRVFVLFFFEFWALVALPCWCNAKRRVAS